MEKRLMMFIACVFLNLGMALAQTHVSGVVTSSEDGSPIIGASVKIVGTTSGTVTDIDGNFALDLESNKAELEFSYIGMVTKKLKASEKMQVVLDPDTHVLEQVIITGYGAAKKLGSVVGAISNIGEKKLETVVTLTLLMRSPVRYLVCLFCHLPVTLHSLHRSVCVVSTLSVLLTSLCSSSMVLLSLLASSAH